MEHIDDTTLNQYLDSTLDPPSHGAVGKHLAECQECQERLNELQILFVTLDNVPDVPLDIDLSERVVAQLRPEGQAQRIPRWLPLLLAIQATAAFFLLISAWSAAQPMLTEAGTLLTESIVSSLEVPSLDQLAELVGSQLDELAQQIHDVRPEINLPNATWLLLIGLALVAWLVGNGFLLKKSENGY